MPPKTYRYRPCPATLSQVWVLHARLSSQLLGSNLGSKHSGELGRGVRKCMATLKYARQLATLVDAANPGLWAQHRLGLGKPPTDPKALLLWIVAAAMRDLHRLACDESFPRNRIVEIRERQTMSVSVVQSFSPTIGVDAAVVLNADPVQATRAVGPAPKRVEPGRALRLV